MEVLEDLVHTVFRDGLFPRNQVEVYSPESIFNGIERVRELEDKVIFKSQVFGK